MANRAVFRKVGEWEKLHLLELNLAKEIIGAKNTALRRWGLKAEGTAKLHISNQDLGWQALAPATLARKIRLGFSTNILVETSTYFQNITSWIDAPNNTVYAGVKRGVREPNGEDTGMVAAIHEYGSQSGRIPARPLWQPTYAETMEWHIKNNNPAKIFIKNIKSKYGV